MAAFEEATVGIEPTVKVLQTLVPTHQCTCDCAGGNGAEGNAGCLPHDPGVTRICIFL